MSMKRVQVLLAIPEQENKFFQRKTNRRQKRGRPAAIAASSNAGNPQQRWQHEDKLFLQIGNCQGWEGEAGNSLIPQWEFSCLMLIKSGLGPAP